MRLPGKMRARGYVLIAVLSILAILLTIVAALQHQGLARKRAATLMEARFLASRAADTLMNHTEANLEGQLPPGAVKWEFQEGVPLEAQTGMDTTTAPKTESVYFKSEVFPFSGVGLGSKLFSDVGLLSIGSLDSVLDKRALRGRDRRTSPGTVRLEGEPTSNESTYQVFAKRRFQSVYSVGFPYAAYAPGSGQRVDIEHLGTWTLPALGQLDANKVNPLDLHSGLAPKVGAGGDVAVAQFPYGEAYSRNGKVSVRGGAISYTGHLPFQKWGKSVYTKLVEQSVDKVRIRLASIATNKTGAIFGNLDINEVKNLVIRGQVPRNIFTYQSASQWYFFLFPTIKTEGPSIRISLHVPLPADGQSSESGADQAEKIANLQERNRTLNAELLPPGSPPEQSWDQNTPGVLPKLSWAAKEYQQIEAEIQNLQNRYNAENRKSKPKQSILDILNDAIKKARKRLDKKRKEVNNLESEADRRKDELTANKAQIDALSKEQEDGLDTWTEGDPQGPDLENQKRLKKKRRGAGYVLDKDGMAYYSYVGVLVRLGHILKNLIIDAMKSFPMLRIRINLGFVKFTILIPDLLGIPRWIKQIGESLKDGLMRMVSVPVSLSYLEGKVIPVTRDDVFECPKTFTVPRGRSVYLQKGMHVNGDLWLQKGSSLVVQGNLLMLDPGQGGSSLLTRTMTPKGRIFLEEGASLVVTGNLTGAGERVLGSVIVCGPAGVNQALTSTILCFGDVYLPHGTGGGLPVEELVAWVGGESKRKYIKFFMEKVSPNLSKFPAFLGPFQPRNPFFGRHPVTLRLFPPKPVPIPTFETTGQNLNNRIFGHLSMVMTAHMNFALGENLTTSTSWWMFGKGQPAVFPKAASAAIRTDLTKVTSALDSALKFVDKIGDPSATFGNLFGEARKSLVSPAQLAKDVLVPIAASALNPDPTGQSQQRIEQAYQKVVGTNSLESITRRLVDKLGISESPQNAFLKSPGVLRAVSDAATTLGHSPGFTPPDSSLREAANLLLLECPGLFCYAGKSMTVGGPGWSNDPAARAVGWFVAKGNLDMNANYAIGSLLSLEGSIRARRLYYSPHYTKASVYIPKALKRGGTGINANFAYWANAMNYKYGSDLNSNTALDVPSRLPYFKAAEGWAK